MLFLIKIIIDIFFFKKILIKMKIKKKGMKNKTKKLSIYICELVNINIRNNKNLIMLTFSKGKKIILKSNINR